MKFQIQQNEEKIRFYHKKKYRGYLIFREIPSDKRGKVAVSITRILNSYIEDKDNEN